MRSILTSVLFLALTGPAHAVDGVLEINQTCAVNTGCFASDTPGYPVTISQAGSYVLTSNLVVPDADTTGISVGTGGVGIDLNNFSILRSGCPPSCVPSNGSGSGVVSTGPTQNGISVKNGSIMGMGLRGIALGPDAEVLNVRLHAIGLTAISVGAGSTVSTNTVSFTGTGSGIRSGSKSTITGNTVSGTAQFAIEVGDDSLVTGNTASGNGNIGISAGDRSTITNNAIGDNNGPGLVCGDECLVSGNTVAKTNSTGLTAGNRSTVTGNTVDQTNTGLRAGDFSTVSGNTAGETFSGHSISVGIGSTVVDNTVFFGGDGGILAGDGSSVQRNTVRNNNGYGLDLGTDTTYRENTITNNSTGGVTGNGVNLGDNYCAGTGVVLPSCP